MPKGSKELTQARREENMTDGMRNWKAYQVKKRRFPKSSFEEILPGHDI